MSTKFIVTGGAGFIGSNLVAALNARGEDHILVVDELGTDEKWKNLVGLRYEDYMGRDDFRAAIQHDALTAVDAVFHLGACSSTTEKDAGFLADNNYRYTRELCEWCLHNGARFIYASSAATYGDGESGYSDDDRHTLTLKPLNMYGYSKHMFDLWALRHALLDRIVGLKYFNVFGPREDHKGDMRSVVHKAYHQIRETGEVRLFKSYKPKYRDGEQVRDFIFIQDAVDVTLFFLDHPGVSGLFNCGTGQARTWNDLAKAVFAAMGLEPRITYIDMPPALREKYQYHTQADVLKLRKAGYDKPFTPLEEAAARYVKEWLSAPR
ncbi:MAG TPA: ADP-glyceromanno-heptose 6-epimerase [Kiritimatiellia bacterium]|nr:ADP-glyceromanno-heptose 6-epimerase [Kiritimatiellia bacterium]HRZ13197.1 ADP-glyceromanno-heptose 6-epimerase [Kiritimatiellia bacterium]HSA19764.1 ADP-glyceromanno-heptose 6-epimerase [Kiritimatiellia bacterium]